MPEHTASKQSFVSCFLQLREIVHIFQGHPLLSILFIIFIALALEVRHLTEFFKGNDQLQNRQV